MIRSNALNSSRATFICFLNAANYFSSASYAFENFCENWLHCKFISAVIFVCLFVFFQSKDPLKTSAIHFILDARELWLGHDWVTLGRFSFVFVCVLIFSNLNLQKLTFKFKAFPHDRYGIHCEFFLIKIAHYQSLQTIIREPI